MKIGEFIVKYSQFLFITKNKPPVFSFFIKIIKNVIKKQTFLYRLCSHFDIE